MPEEANQYFFIAVIVQIDRSAEDIIYSKMWCNQFFFQAHAHTFDVDD